MREVSHKVTREEAGRTLASLLKEHAGVSHRNARGIVEAGLVTLDGTAADDPVFRPPAGTVIAARYDPATRYRGRGRGLEETSWFHVVLEDPAFVVVEKPAGLATVPVGRRTGRSLVEKLLEAESPAHRQQGLWVVHRIDRFVSGLVVVARERYALKDLRDQFAARTVVRDYVALCEGAPPEAEGDLVGHLQEDPRTHKLSPVEDPTEGVAAELHYRVAERFPHACLVEVRLGTGRRNQIRVQMAAAGCPLLGDRSYGRHSTMLPRVALHAARLVFRHPRTGESVECISEPPPDFLTAVRRLREGAHPHPEEHAPSKGAGSRPRRKIRPV